MTSHNLSRQRLIIKGSLIHSCLLTPIGAPLIKIKATTKRDLERVCLSWAIDNNIPFLWLNVSPDPRVGKIPFHIRLYLMNPGSEFVILSALSMAIYFPPEQN